VATQHNRLSSYRNRSKMTVGEYLLHWLETSVKHTVRRSTYVSYEHLIRNHLIPALGMVPLQKLQPVQVQALYSEKLNGGRSDGKEGGLAPRTVRYLHTVLREALHQAVKWGMVARNVCDATDPPPCRATTGEDMDTARSAGFPDCCCRRHVRRRMARCSRDWFATR